MKEGSKKTFPFRGKWNLSAPSEVESQRSQTLDEENPDHHLAQQTSSGLEVVGGHKILNDLVVSYTEPQLRHQREEDPEGN